MAEFYKTPSTECQSGWSYREQAMAFQKLATNTNWGWVYEKTPWVMVSSLQVLDSKTKTVTMADGSKFTFDYGGDKSTREQNILFCGKSTSHLNGNTASGTIPGTGINIYSGFQETYEFTYNRPVPGLKELTVEYKGSMGSTRECKVKFQVHTDEQLEVYELLYMVPSAGIRVEWGWSLSPTNEAVIPIGTAVMDDVKFQKAAEEKENEYLGHYGGQQGVVSNFQWSRLSDGSYDCEITVITRGEAYISSPVTSKRKKVLKDNSIETKSQENTNTDSGDKPVIIQDMYGVWQTAWKQIDNGPKNAIQIPTGKLLGPRGEGGLEIAGVSMQLKYDAPDSRDGFSTLYGIFDAIDNLPYVSLQFVLTHMINANLSDIIVGASSEEGYSASFDPNQRVVAYFEDDKPIYVQHRLNQVSVNPLICIIPGEDGKWKLEGDGELKHYVTGDVDAFNQFADLCFKDWAEDNRKLDLRWILINLEYIKVKLDDAETVDEFLSNLLSDIADCTGGVWDLSLHSEYGVVRIIDAYTITETKPTPMPINLSTATSAGGVLPDKGCTIRSFSMESDMSSKVATEAIYGGSNGQSSGDDVGSGEKGNEATFGWRLYAAKSRNLALGGNGTTTAPTGNKEADGKYAGKDDTPDKTLLESINQVRSSVTKEKVDTAKANLNEYLLWTTPNERSGPDTPNASSMRPMLPIKLKFTCDGFTLFKTGYMIAPSFLPRRFQGWMDFMVMKTSHTVTNTDFTTDVECILRPKFEKDDTQVTPATSTGAPTSATTAIASTDRVAIIPGKYDTALDNNPFNLRPNSGAQFNGAIGKKEGFRGSTSIGFFIVFDTKTNGVRAGLKNLEGYFTRRKLDTVTKIINTYAPAGTPGQTTSDTNIYVKNVVAHLKANWNPAVTAVSTLSFAGAAETNASNIKMFKELNKAILQQEGKLTVDLSTSIDSFDIKNLA